MSASKLLDQPQTAWCSTRELPFEDGEKVESAWHLFQMILLCEVIKALHLDWYVGANMFVYFDEDQVKTRNFKGPDYFVVRDVPDARRDRKCWEIWNEGNKRPNVVIELLSESTESEDKNNKKLVYQDDLKVPEYFLFSPSGGLLGYRLVNGIYKAINADSRGRMVSEQLGLALRVWKGAYQDSDSLIWLRWETLSGQLLLTQEEMKEQALQLAADERTQKEQALKDAERALEAAERERQRADKFAALLKERGIEL